MTEAEAIVSRHSVRKYKPEKIEEEKASLIRKKIEEINAEGDLHLPSGTFPPGNSHQFFHSP